ncbi:MAG: hypothetical protein QOE45_1496 [Frankiaceae bacterium]|jgi:hypothetical protein|nr:hypothetical protein [Frankiaceae bacterium]
MIRRLVATAGLVTLFAGLAAAVAVPASAGEDATTVCIGREDQRTPGYGQAVCIKDFVPSSDILTVPGEVRAPGGPGVHLPPGI